MSVAEDLGPKPLLHPAQEQVEPGLGEFLPLQRGRVRSDLLEPGLVDIGTRRVGSGIAYAGGRVWVSVYDARFVLALDPVKGTFLAAVHAGGQPRDSLVVGSRLWGLDQLGGALVPVTP